MQNYNDIDKYLNVFPKDTQVVLQKIRNSIRKAAPNATETISYGIPTFKLNGKNLVHFAAFKNHYSFFPTSSGVEAFKNELKEYKISKGTIQFPIDKPLPFDLLTKIVEFRRNEVLEKKKRRL